MPTLQAKIESVVMKETAKGPIYRALINGTEYSTFDRALATQAKELIGQVAEVEYAVQQNGQWTNHYLNGVTNPQLGLAIPANGNADFATFATAAPTAAVAQESDKETRIMRQTALKCAVATLPHFEPGERGRATIQYLCEQYFDYFVNGWTPSAPATDDGIPF